MKAARGWRRWWWWWFHPAVVEEAAHGLFHGWCNSRRKEGRRGAWERKRKEGRKRWKKACTHPGHCNCHGVYNCCTLLCSLCGSPLQPSASVTLSLQLAAGHSAVVVVVVVDSRGGWRRGETGEISLRFHGADLNRRKGERERERWLRWKESGLALHCSPREIGLRFVAPRDVSLPNEFPHLGERVFFYQQMEIIVEHVLVVVIYRAKSRETGMNFEAFLSFLHPSSGRRIPCETRDGWMSGGNGDCCLVHFSYLEREGFMGF